MTRILIRAAAVLVIIEVLYLVVANAVLNLPATQALINRSQDGKIALQWDSAWSILPFRLHVSGLKVNGQSWSQQFEIDAPSVSASLDVPSLFFKTLRFNGLRSGDLSVRFRPRPSPDKDDAAMRPYYPEIAGRDPNSAAEPAPTQSPGWLMVFSIAGIDGKNDLWLGANRIVLEGNASAVIGRQNRHGPLVITRGQADLTVSSFSAAGHAVTRGGTFKGTFEVASYLPQENRGAKVLAFLTLDADVDLPIGGLDFLNTFLNNVADLTVGGEATIKGRLAYSKGALTPGADIVIEAEKLKVDLPPYSVSGVGQVEAKVDEARPETLVATLAFKSISATHEPAKQVMFDGENISIAVERSALVLPELSTEKVPHRIALNLPSVSVPDVNAYQRFLPDEWNATLAGGNGSLEGTAEMSATDLDVDLLLRSDAAEVKLTRNSFQSNLNLGIKARGGTDAGKATIDVSGTFVELDNSKVSDNDGDDSKPWDTRFGIASGSATFALPDTQDAKTGIVGFWSLFQEKELKSMLSDVDGDVTGSLKVSNLDWITFLFNKPFSLQVGEAAEVDANLVVRSGRLMEGSSLKMAPRSFTLGILDYIVDGTGGFALAVAKSGAKPDLSLDANLTGASLRLEDEEKAVVQEVSISVDAVSEAVSAKEGGTLKSVVMEIPSAKIADMTAYNAYLPKTAPIRILSGTANLAAKLVMAGESATGFMKMATSRIDTDIQGDRISGVVALDVKIAGGSAKDRRFEIGGSTLVIDQVRTTGSHATSGGWSATADIAKGSVVWKRPMTTDLSLTFHMTDASPILTVFSANRKDNKWLDRLLDLHNINGKATIRAEPDSLVIPYAFATSDTFDVGAKGIFTSKGRQGVFYARTGKLAGILAIDNDRKKFEAIEATKKFESYTPGGPVPGIHDAPRSSSRASTRPAPYNVPPAPAASPKKQPFSLFKKKSR
ncbi:MAG: hypothetical protein KDK07_21260 [Bauldia sp.]|nr:hypothetical protein [Bauldia sp.]